MTDSLDLIDVWGQPALAKMFAKMPEVVRLFERSGSADMLTRDVSASQLVDAMDVAGIKTMLLSAWHRPGQWVLSNDELAAYIGPHRDRLKGLAAVDLDRPVEAVRELHRAVNEFGFVGLRVVPWLYGKPPSDRLYFPLFVKCVELDIPFCTQVGHTGPLMPSETGRPVPYLDEVALFFPELRIVAGHIGYPWTEEMIAVAWKHANVYIDTSAYLPKYYPATLIQFMNSYGSDKVMFGTNYPQLNLSSCATQARGLQLKDEAKVRFLSGNARKVFKLP